MGATSRRAVRQTWQAVGIIAAQSIGDPERNDDARSTLAARPARRLTIIIKAKNDGTVI
jgi:hypothetical protein